MTELGSRSNLTHPIQHWRINMLVGELVPYSSSDVFTPAMVRTGQQVTFVIETLQLSAGTAKVIAQSKDFASVTDFADIGTAQSLSTSTPTTITVVGGTSKDWLRLRFHWTAGSAGDIVRVFVYPPLIRP